MEDKVFIITGKGDDDSISIVDNGIDKIKVYEPLYSKSFLYIGDKVKIEVFGESDGYKQAIVAEVVEKASNHEFTPKYYPDYMYRSANEIKKRFQTKENLMEQEKKDHYDYINQLTYTIMKKELIDAYLYMLSKCNSWEEIETIYNQRPYLMEVR